MADPQGICFLTCSTWATDDSDSGGPQRQRLPTDGIHYSGRIEWDDFGCKTNSAALGTGCLVWQQMTRCRAGCHAVLFAS